MAGETALVLGATGGVGGAIAAALKRHGWRVRATARDPGRLSAEQRATGYEWVTGDAMDAASIARAAAGVQAIVHAVSPPGYQNWGKLVLPMIDSTIAAAKAAGALIVLPGTIYNYDPKVTPVIAADTPQTGSSEKGRIRIELEARLERASQEVPVLILRAGDFFGPGVRSSWFAQALVRPGTPVKRLINPGKGVGHSWAYLPDLAETFARLMDAHDRLAPFQVLQFEGTWDPDGTHLPAAIAEVAGRKLPVWQFPWWAMRLLAPFGGFPAAVVEIEQVWRHPVRLDNRELVALLGEEPRTPLPEALRTTLADMGSL